MRPTYRGDIAGLRGLAILLVIAFHAGVSTTAGGFVGVDVFFVLSGYLITGLLAHEALDTGDIDLARFYARRARRLLPAFLLVLLATLGIALWLYAPIDLPGIARDGRAVALHYGNVLFAGQALNYHASSTNPLLHTWSLAVEEQFYVIWPLLFMFVARATNDETALRRRLIVAVIVAGVASFVGSLIATRNAQPWAFFGMPTRIWEFALGAALGLRTLNGEEERIGGVPGVVLQAAGLAAIAFAVLTYDEALPYPGYAALLPAIGTVAILAGGARLTDGFITRLLSAPWLQWFGRISYSWYLWHWPLVGLGVVLDWKIGVVGKLAWSAFALVLAVLTERFVERPFREGDALNDAPHKLNLVALGASFAAALIAWCTLVVAQQRASSPIQRTILAARTDGMRHQCWGSLTETPTAPCVFGDLGATTSVVLMGDSHAEHWLPAMDLIGRERHWKVYAMVKPACPVADIPEMINTRLKRAYTECHEWRRAKFAGILALRPSFVMLSSYDNYVAADGDAPAWHLTPAMWRDGLRRTYSVFSNAGIPVVAMRDVPMVGFDVPSCLSRQAAGTPFQMRDCRYRFDDAVHAPAVAAQTEAARGLRTVGFVNMNDRLCAPGVRSTCPVIVGNAIVYQDDDHITATFSRAQASVLADRIVSTLRGVSRR